MPIAGVLVRLAPAGDSASARQTETDALGYFAFSGVAAGEHVLALSRIGVAGLRLRVRVDGDGVATVEGIEEAAPGEAAPGAAPGEAVQAGAAPGDPADRIAVGAVAVDIEITLASRAVELEGVVVEAEQSRDRARFEEAAGITVQEIGRAELKSIPGIAEADPLRAVEVLPGVTTVSDFSAAFNVRGGSADQNLILLDDIPIYNPFHLGNLFSVFNADMVARAELRAGGFPAEYGGRVSSVLTVETDAGDGVLSVDAGISVLASRAAVDGALPESVGSALGFTSTRWRVSGRRSYFDVLLRPFTQFPYHLTDLQAVFEGWTSRGHRLRFTGYTGRDVLDLTGVSEVPLGVALSWGNDAFGGSWTNPMRGGGSLAVRGAFSRFTSDFGFDDFGVAFDTRIQRGTLQVDLERRPRPGLRWKSGLAANDREYGNSAAAGGTTFNVNEGSGIELSAYSQLHWEWGDWLSEAGLRADHWRPESGGEATTALSPRLAVKRFVRDRNSALRLSAGRYTQFIHSLRDEEFPFGLDVWVLAGQDVPHVTSDQVQLGVESFFGDDDAWFATLEGYYRTFDGVVAFNPADDPNDPFDDRISGRGTAYGADLYLRRDLGPTTGWISVSLLKTERTFPDTRVGTDPPPDITYPPIFDRRVDVDLVLRRDLAWGLEGGLRFNFGTGLPYTRPVGAFQMYDPRTVDMVLEPEYETAVVLGPRNGHRYPARHRLDLSLRKTIERGWGTLVPYLNVINAYNQKNVLFYFFEYNRTVPRRSGISMIPILPTVGLEVSF